MKKPPKVRISPLFLIPCLALWLVCDGWFGGAYLLAVVLHELSHVYMAGILGLETGRLCLSFYGCKAEMNGLDGWEIGRELPVALAGPIFNLMAAAVFTVLSQVLYFWYYPLLDFAVANLFLGLFNLLPVLPLDGGRVLRSIVCAGLPRERGTRVCVRLSVGFGLIMVAVFVYFAVYGRYMFFLGVLGIFIIVGAVGELNRVSRYRLSVLTGDGKLKKPLRVRRYAVSCEEDMKRALAYFKDDCFNVVDVIARDGSLERTLTEIELRNELLK